MQSRLNFSFFFCQTTDVGYVFAEIVGWQDSKSKWLEDWNELRTWKYSLFQIPDVWTGCLVLGKKLHSTKIIIKASYDGLNGSANPVGQPRDATIQWVFQSGFHGWTLAVCRVHHVYGKKQTTWDLMAYEHRHETATPSRVFQLNPISEEKWSQKMKFSLIGNLTVANRNCSTEVEMTEQLLNWPRFRLSFLRLFSHCHVRTAHELYSGSWNHRRNWSKTNWQPQRG